MQKYKLIYYELKNGRRPAEEFIFSQNEKLKGRIGFVVNVLLSEGPNIHMPYSRAMGNGLYELRIQAGNNIARILYFFFDKDKIVLTNGFIKKTQKTPVAELERARRYKADFERRNHQ